MCAHVRHDSIHRHHNYRYAQSFLPACRGVKARWVYDKSLVDEGDEPRRGDPCGRPWGYANACVLAGRDATRASPTVAWLAWR